MKPALSLLGMTVFKYRPWESWPLAVRAGVFALAYFGAACLGEVLSFREQDFSTFWPPSGLMLAALLLHRKREWPVLFATALAASVAFEWTIHHHHAGIGMAFATGNFLQGALGAWALKRWGGGTPSLRRVRDVCALTIVGMAAPLVSATAGVLAARCFFHGVVFAALWPRWWSADALGVLLVAPLVLALTDRDRHLARPRLWTARFGEAAALLAAVGLMADVTFGGAGSRRLLFAFPYVTFPGLLWAAMRLGPRSAASCSLLIACVATWNTSIGFGPFNRAGHDAAEAALLLQVFVVVTQLFALLPTAIMSQWRAAEGKAHALNATLERRVTERTAELEQSEAALREARDHLEARVRERTAQLEQAQAHFAAFMENSPAAVFMKDAEGRMVFANQRLLEAFRVERGELIGKLDHEWLPAEAAKALHANDQRILRENKAIEVVEYVPTPDGEEREWLSFKFPVTGRNGKMLIGGVALDITSGTWSARWRKTNPCSAVFLKAGR